MSTLRFLSAEDVRRCLPMQDAIAGMKSAFAQLSAGQADMPLRSRVAGEVDGITLTMPAYLRTSKELGIKIVSVYPQNTDLPIIHAMVMALDSQTGQPLALMEGSSLTAIRTGAGAGAATDILANPDASVVAIIGSGVQARTQLEAVCTVRPIKQVFVYSPNADHAHYFAQEMRGQNSIPDNIAVTANADEAVQYADIICTATTASKPVFDGKNLKDGAHINAVGSYTPTMQEVDFTTLQRARIYLDSKQGALAEAGELIIALKQNAIAPSAIIGEIGEVMVGQIEGRTQTHQITYFKSAGVAVQDAVSAHICLKNATLHNIGQVLKL